MASLHSISQDETKFSITANIIFNLAHLGLSIEDTKYLDIETYFELVNLELKTLDNSDTSKKATQTDIDSFLI